MSIEVDFAITNNCNLTCKHCCYSSGEKKSIDLPLSVIEKTLVQLKELGADELHLAGGEPFMRSDLLDIVRIGKELNYKVQILSNGYCVSRDKLKELKKIGLDKILFSIDDVGEYHDLFRNQKGVFQSVLETIRFCKMLGFYTRVNTVVTTESMHRIPELNRLLNAEGVDRHSLFTLTPIGRGNQLIDIAPNLEQWDRFKDFIKAYGSIEKPRIEIFAQKLLSKFDETHEYEAMCRIRDKDDCVISASGEVFPCYIYTSTDKSLGNILKNEIRDIWNSDSNWSKYPVYNRINCSRCSGITCNGGCAGYNLTVNNQQLDCDIRCDVNNGRIPDCVRLYEKLWG